VFEWHYYKVVKQGVKSLHECAVCLNYDVMFSGVVEDGGLLRVDIWVEQDLHNHCV
jgi:hypothetical protein